MKKGIIRNVCIVLGGVVAMALIAGSIILTKNSIAKSNEGWGLIPNHIEFALSNEGWG